MQPVAIDADKLSWGRIACEESVHHRVRPIWRADPLRLRAALQLNLDRARYLQDRTSARPSPAHLEVAFAVTAITEWLTGRKIGNLFAGMLVTIIGAVLVLMFVRLPAPLDFVIENVAVVAALIGAIIVGVFYALIRARTSSSGRGRQRAPSKRYVELVLGWKTAPQMQQPTVMLLQSPSASCGQRSTTPAALRCGRVSRDALDRPLDPARVLDVVLRDVEVTHRGQYGQ
jgi:hypothetical protein